MFVKNRVLTQSQIDRLPVTGVRYLRSAGEGLYLQVSAKGEKSWLLLFTSLTDKKRRWHSLGDYDPRLTDLEWAKARRNELNTKHKIGIQPGEEERLAREARLKAPIMKDLVEQYLNHPAKKKKASIGEETRIFERMVLPEWGERKVADITRLDILRLYEEVGGRAPVMANRLRAVLHILFSFALEREMVKFNPVTTVKKVFKEREGERFLLDDEIRVFWTRLGREDAPVGDSIRRALRTVLATAARPGEVCGLRWEHMEPEGEWWLLKSGDSKSDIAQRIYLNAMARRVIGERPALRGAVFPGPHKNDKSITEAALTRVLRRARHFGLPPFTAHDLRRTAATQLGDLGYEDFLIGKILTHTKRSVTSRYNKHQYDAQKREAMDKWSRKLENILSEEDNKQVVIPFKRG